MVVRPFAVIIPAKSHPEVIIAAVAARDPTRAAAYARKYSIPNVHTSYQALLDDPTLDAVYIPLPNGLHYEWALKALKAGKHVLLEKPSVSNAAEARQLFRHPILTSGKATGPNCAGGPLVLLDAVHTRFHPAFRYFLTLLNPAEIQHVQSEHYLPAGIMPDSDIRFQFSLAGGTLMDLGSYNIQTLRQCFGAEPVECITATPRLMPNNDPDIDQAFTATWRFPNGGRGSIIADLSARVDGDWGSGGWLSWLTGGRRFPLIKSPLLRAQHRETVALDPSKARLEIATTRTVTFWNVLAPSVWHRIDIVEDKVLRDVMTKDVKKSWTEMEYVKCYEDGKGVGGDDSWTTYRHMMEGFVNRIKGRKGLWIEGEDSIKQMEMIDQGYEKAGMKIRPSTLVET
ncbi:MAG: hypothetical protein Q9220_007089 [cf. Caloplaca sp. 1 TL-2023]